jgi:hypothetical protein
MTMNVLQIKYPEFLPKGERHSIEIACIEPGPRKEGRLVFILAGALFYGTVSSQKNLVSKYTIPEVLTILTT